MLSRFRVFVILHNQLVHSGVLHGDTQYLEDAILEPARFSTLRRFRLSLEMGWFIESFATLIVIELYSIRGPRDFDVKMRQQ